MLRQPGSDMDYQRYSDQASAQEHAHGKPAHQSHMGTSGHLRDAGSRVVHSTLKLKMSVALSSLLSIALMCLAAVQSYKQFIILGYAPLVSDNSRTAAINAVVAVYGAITGMS